MPQVYANDVMLWQDRLAEFRHNGCKGQYPVPPDCVSPTTKEWHKQMAAYLSRNGPSSMREPPK